MKKYIFYILGFFAVSFLAYCFFPIITYDETKSPGRIFLTDRNGKIITDKTNEYGYKKDIEIDLNSQFVKDLLTIEDKNYYNHFGVDILSKLGAVKTNILNQKVISGGSTITEQYIKNKYFQNSKRSYLQKLREAFLAFCFTAIPPLPLGEGQGVRALILTNYLNNVYFGNNIYGIGAAIEVYFGKYDLDDLNDEEITLLISLIHNPGIKSLEEKNFREYFDKVKNKLGYTFDRTIYKLNKKENIDRFPFVTNRFISLENDNFNRQNNTPLPLGEGLGVRAILLEGKEITSIDSNLQQYAKDILNKTLNELKDKNVTNGAIFAIIPSTGEVLIYQGSRDFYSIEIDGQVDVIQSLRQSGSTMKPFLYLMALENGANPDDLILDLENQYNSFQDGKTYISNNYSLKEYGLVRLKKALGNSLNNATVRLAKELGLNKVYDFYKDFGFYLPERPEHYGYSLVLGNPSIKLEDLVISYSKLIPNIQPLLQDRGLGSGIINGELNIEREVNLPNNSPLLTKEGARGWTELQSKFLLYDILSDPDNRDLSFGVNSILNTSIYQAVKTGTSSDFRDNLVISYHPDLVLGVWVGNNDNSSMVGVTGITGAGYIWHQIIEKAIELGYIKDRKMEIPDQIEESKYCLDEKCFRKELIYKKQKNEYFSRIIDNKYSSKDLYEKLTSDEIDRLKDFQIYLDKN